MRAEKGRFVEEGDEVILEVKTADPMTFWDIVFLYVRTETFMRVEVCAEDYSEIRISPVMKVGDEDLFIKVVPPSESTLKKIDRQGHWAFRIIFGDESAVVRADKDSELIIHSSKKGKDDE